MNIISYEKQPEHLLVNLFFSLHFIPLNPDPNDCGSDRIHVVVVVYHVTIVAMDMGS